MRVILLCVDVNGRVMCGKGDVLGGMNLRLLFSELEWERLNRDFGYVCDLDDGWDEFVKKGGKEKFGVSVKEIEVESVSRVRVKKDDEGVEFVGVFDENGVYEGEYEVEEDYVYENFVF